MDKDIESLHKNRTWKFYLLLMGQEVVGCKGDVDMKLHMIIR